MAQTPQKNNNQQSLINVAIKYLQGKNDLGYQKSYHQFYKKGHEQECKIRLGNNGHFIDFYMQSSKQAVIQKWENFLDNVDKKEPGKWKIIPGIKRSQLILKDNPQPTTQKEVQEWCDLFYGLFQRYDENYHN